MQILSLDIFITTKDVETDNPVFKATFVGHGNRDTEKNQLFHDSNMARQSSASLLVNLAAIIGFDVWAEYISQSYLQSESELLRELYLRPNRRLKIPAWYPLKILRTLYGLADSGDCWHATFEKIWKTASKWNPWLAIFTFFRRWKVCLSKALASYVDDTSCGDNSFAELTKSARESFDFKKREYENVRFSDLYIERHADGFHIHQRAYIDRLEQLQSDA